MGKIARTIATIHDYSTDYVIDAAKVAGRSIKSTGIKVGQTIKSGISEIRTEHHMVEARRQAKKEAKAHREQVAQEMTEKFFGVTSEA